MVQRQYLFDCVRRDLFHGSLNQAQVDGINVFLDWYDYDNPPIPDRYHIGDRRFAYVLATSFHETGATMQPVTEYGSQKYLKSKPYYPWHGRGHIQLTWEENYARQDEKLGLGGALMKNPDLALDRDISLKVILGGMVDGDFTGKKLSDFFTDQRTDWYEARTIVNGHDRASDIANYAVLFCNALTHL